MYADEKITIAPHSHAPLDTGIRRYGAFWLAGYGALAGGADELGVLGHDARLVGN